MRLAELNRADRAAFVAAVGAVFEHAPWVAAAAYDTRPFADRAALHAAMMAAVVRAPEAARVAFLNNHPELGSRAEIVADLTPDSRQEQMSAGLTQLSPDEAAWFRDRNRAYRERFGFPFIVAVRRLTRQGVMDAFEQRGASTRAAELAQALSEIAWITRLRLADLVEDA